MKTFAFEHNEPVRLDGTTERGKVVGRADFPNKCNQYSVRYTAADGRLIESWWDEDALVSEKALRAATLTGKPFNPAAA